MSFVCLSKLTLEKPIIAELVSSCLPCWAQGVHKTLAMNYL